jgi:dynein heavy chain
MTHSIEEFVANIYFGTIPKVWKEFSYLSNKPLGPFIADLCARLNFVQKWIDEGTPKIFWVSGFFHPRKFFTGTLDQA